MSKEKKLLERWLDDTIFEPEELDYLIEETRELLAQPEHTEQEPFCYITLGEYERYFYCGRSIDTYIKSNPFDNESIPLYTAPPKREPLTPQQISVGNQSMLNVTRDAFVKGVKFAEQQHGIGE
jgi:hypothetical protein